MNESILNSVKHALGIESEYQHFDGDIIMHINSILMVLTQIGVGPKDGFSIKDESATWSDLLGDAKDLEAVKTYIYTRVRVIFDPPTSTAAMEAMNNVAKELEWRLNSAVDY